jgi:nucleoside-triphosphatase
LRGYALSRVLSCVERLAPESLILGFTGAPGVGKSTLFAGLVRELRSRGCIVGGIVAPEVREGGRRLGFKIVDIMRGREGWLARRGPPIEPHAPRVGSYHVIVSDTVRVGVEALTAAVNEAHVIGIDEVGPMELAVEPLRKAIVDALKAAKPRIVVYHRRLPRSDPEIYGLISRGCTVEVTLGNREELREGLRSIAELIASKAGCS